MLIKRSVKREGRLQHLRAYVSRRWVGMLTEGRAENARVDHWLARAKMEKCRRSASFPSPISLERNQPPRNPRSLRFPFDLTTSGRIWRRISSRSESIAANNRGGCGNERWTGSKGDSARMLELSIPPRESVMTAREIDCFSSIISGMRCYERKSITKLQNPKIPRESLPRSGSSVVDNSDDRVCFVSALNLFTIQSIHAIHAHIIYLLVIPTSIIRKYYSEDLEKEQVIELFNLLQRKLAETRANSCRTISRRTMRILFVTHRFGIDSGRDSPRSTIQMRVSSDDRTIGRDNSVSRKSSMFKSTSGSDLTFIYQGECRACRFYAIIALIPFLRRR